MERERIARACATAGIHAGRAIRDAIHAMPLRERAERVPSPLKPRVGELTRGVDRLGDSIGIEWLGRLADDVGHRIDLVVDPQAGSLHSIGKGRGNQVIYAYMDAVDGTIKVGGLGNDLARGRFRGANDGGWAAALAFTSPTSRPLEEIRLGDFVVAAVFEGNPTLRPSSPQEVVTVPGTGGLITCDVSRTDPSERDFFAGRRVFTTTNPELGQTMAYLDSFQAFDRDTRAPGDEELAVELYRGLINRHERGAFDVLRQYANLSALLRVMLGWRDEACWIEAQGSAFVVVNENLFNLVPAVATISGAGGLSVDFEGRPLAERLLRDGRTNVIHAANAPIRDAVLWLVRAARERCGP